MEEKDLQIRIDFLEKENDKLKDNLLDLTTQLNYSIEQELAELVRNIYESINIEPKNKENQLTREKILTNLKKYLENFSKDYKFKL